MASDGQDLEANVPMVERSTTTLLVARRAVLLCLVCAALLAGSQVLLRPPMGKGEEQLKVEDGEGSGEAVVQLYVQRTQNSEPNPMLPLFQIPLFVLFCIIQFCAYKRSKGQPFEIEDGLTPASKAVANEDLFGAQLQLTQIHKLQELCGIEAKNQYISGDSRFYLSERSDCCQRIVASTNRELTLFGHAGPSQESPVVLRMFKPYHLQGCCCCRPSMIVDLPDGTPVGHVEDPCKCCVIDQQVFDARDQLRYQVVGKLCQLGAFCPLCDDMSFQVNDNAGMTVGEIVKLKLTCRECCLKTNRFIINFPDQHTSSLDDKRLLVAAAMLLDLQYFEQKKTRQ